MSQRQKIGLFVKKYTSNFTSGCVQQAIYTKQLLTNCGYDVVLCSIEPDFKMFADTGDPIKFINEQTSLSSFKCMVFVSLHLETSTYPSLINHLRKHVYCVSLVCGNLSCLHQEEFVFQSHNILTHSLDSWYDEYWLLEPYSSMLEYIQLLTKKPVFTVPYVWNASILTSFVKKKQFDFNMDYHEKDRSKINILIAEPNVSTHKTSLIPLMLANEYYRTHRSNVHKIYLLCGVNVKDKCSVFFEQLEIVQDDVLQIYDRIEMPVMLNLLTKQEYPLVCLSHQTNNPYNFWYLEMLHLNIPIVHNSQMLENNGYYYTTSEMLSAVDLIEKARTTFYITESYRKMCDNIFTRVSVNNLTNKNNMACIIKRIFQSRPDDNAMEESPFYDQLNGLVTSFVKVIQFINNQTKIENLLFYNGVGIVIFVENESQLTLLQCTLESLKHISNHLRVEIVFASDQVDKSSVKLMVESVIQNQFNIELMDTCAEQQTTDSFVSHCYTACTYSNFERGILLKPGTILLSEPDELIRKYLGVGENTFRYCSSFNRMSSLDATDSHILKNLVTRLDLDEHLAAIDPTELVNQGGVFFFNKRDTNCKKVLAIMCELYKINVHLCTHVNVLELVCKAIFRNSNSKIKYHTFVYGLVHNNDFHGYGIAYKSAYTTKDDESFEFFIKNIPINLDCSSNFNNNRAMINLNNNDVQITTEENKLFKFKGRAKAQKACELLN